MRPAVVQRTGERISRAWLAIVLAVVVVAALALVVWLPWFLRPGPFEVLRGLAQHAFVLGWLLLLTHWTRTVSLATLGAWWVVGVFLVFVTTFLAELPFGMLFGPTSTVLGDVFAPLIEESVKLLFVGIFLWLALRRRGSRPSASDAMLIGFVIGAGVSFNEDALIGSIQLSGAGWTAALPWSAAFPTIFPIGLFISDNHALWASLTGLGLGVAVLFRHVRLAWLVPIVAFVLSATNHMTANHFAGAPFQAIGREPVPIEWALLQAFQLNGITPLVALVVGAATVVVLERRALAKVAWVGRTFAPVGPFGQAAQDAPASAGGSLGRVAAASAYRAARRRLMYFVWQARQVARQPDVPSVTLSRISALGSAAGAPAGSTPTAEESGVRLEPRDAPA